MAEILIIDDDKQMNKALTTVVEDLGHAVSSEFTLKGGIEKGNSGNFDVVFLDVRLPDGNGLEALPKIRAAASMPEVNILLEKGLRSTSVIPSFFFISGDITSSYPVIRIIGISCRIFIISRDSSVPFIPGIVKSVITRSNFSG